MRQRESACKCFISVLSEVTLFKNKPISGLDLISDLTLSWSQSWLWLDPLLVLVSTRMGWSQLQHWYYIWLVFPWKKRDERKWECGIGCLVAWGWQAVSETGLYSMEAGGQKDGGHRGVTGSLGRRWVWEIPALKWTFPHKLLFAFPEFTFCLLNHYEDM